MPRAHGTTATATMKSPEVTIDVSESSGQWFVDGFPMILIPQHYFMNNQFALEDALGVDAVMKLLAPAGRESAYVWCRDQAERYGLAGDAVFRHYMNRISQRGWGLFSVRSLDASAATASVRLDHSSFITGSRLNCGRRVCHMVLPWIEGALASVSEGLGKPAQHVTATETQCAAEGRSVHCLFEAHPTA
jgi:hypothetical protein